MGVKSLWELLKPSAYKVQSLEVLSGKIVAVDISVWLHQFILGIGLDDDEQFDHLMNTNSAGKTQEGYSRMIYLRAFFHRICKLLYYGIKPVFVFDGATPLVKQRTVQRRRMKSTKQDLKIKKTAKKLLTRVLEEKKLGTSSLSTLLNKSKNRRSNNTPKKVKEKELNKELNIADEEFNFALNSFEQEKQEKQAEKILLTSPNKSNATAQLRAELNLNENDNIKTKDENDSSSYNLLCDPNNYEFEEEEKDNTVNTKSDEFLDFSQSSFNSQSTVSENDIDVSDEIDPQVFINLPPNMQQEIVSQLRAKRRYKPKSLITNMKKKTPEKFSSSQLQDFLKGSSASLQLRKLMNYSEQQNVAETTIGSLANNDQENEFSIEKVKEEEGEEVNGKEVVHIKQEYDEYEIIAGGKVASDPNQRFVLMEKRTPEKRTSLSMLTTPTSKSTSATSTSTVTVIDDDNDDEFEEISTSNNEGKQEEDTITFTFSKEELANVNKDDLLPDSIFEGFDMPKQLERNFNDEWEEVEPEENNEIINIDDNNQNDEWEEIKDENSSSPIDKEEDVEFVEERNNARQDIDDDDVIITNEDKIDEQPGDNVVHNISMSSEILDDFYGPNDRLLSDREVALQEANALQFEQQLYSDYQMTELPLSGSSGNLYHSLVELAKELLTHFGIPYVVSPSEADAQCGFLSQKGLVDAVITEDSDLFLFGAKYVYRNVFGVSKNVNNAKKEIEEYSLNNIEKTLGLKRWHLIELALLLGSDYTDGVHNVGPVTATQVVDAFNTEMGDISEEECEEKILEALNDFKKWVLDDTYNIGISEKSWGARGEFQVNYKGSKKKFIFPNNFPDKKIVEAYIKPQVDSSLEYFEWADIDSEPSESNASASNSSSDNNRIRLNWNSFYNFCHQRLGWTKDQVDKFIQPVLEERKKRLNLLTKEKDTLTPLEKWLLTANKKTKAAEIESKRVKNAVDSMKCKQLTKKRKKK
ncbi:hypothetical protein ABK040_011979 [Willaertia magna]